MTPETTAAWLAFAGQALLLPDASRLQRALEDLRAIEPASGMPVAELERSLADGAGGLGVEYVRLFLDPGGAPCTVWQSACGPDGRLMGTPHLSALAWYRRFGFAPSLENEPADHAGLLLLFSSYLVSQGETDALSDFVADHIAWIPDLCRQMSACTRLAFYGLLGNCICRLYEKVLPHAVATSRLRESSAERSFS